MKTQRIPMRKVFTDGVEFIWTSFAEENMVDGAKAKEKIDLEKWGKKIDTLIRNRYAIRRDIVNERNDHQ